MKQKTIEYFNGNYLPFYERYLSNLKHLKDAEYQSLCCFHDDKNPSLSINVKSGRYYCHGCNAKGDIFSFYGDQHGLNGNFQEVLKGIASDFGIQGEQKKSRIVKTYDYEDADGSFLFQACRMEPKDFRQRQRNGNGRWIWNLKGIKRVLYRLPEVIKANEVIIVEGEQDADSLSRLGFTATTCPMGAGKWRSEYNQYLKGKDVVVMPDNDEPGREHGLQVAQSIVGTVRSIKIIELPGLPDKGDVSDFIAGLSDADTAAEKLSVAIEHAEPYQPDKIKTIEDAILTTPQVCELKVEEKKSFIDPWLKENEMGLISGQRGMGKTMFAMGIVDAVSSGESFGPWECKNTATALYLDGEMTLQDDRERIEMLKLNRQRKQPLYFYSDAYASRLGLPRANLTDEKWRSEMKQILIQKNVRLWVIDNIASLAPGLDENQKKDWDPINQWILGLRYAGISTLMLHHTNKEGGQRGTSAREDNLDFSIMLKSPTDYTTEDGARFVVHFTKQRVQNKYLKLLSDTEFKLIQDESGHYVWSTSNVKGVHKREVLKLLDEGLTQSAICETLDLSKGYVSKIRKRAENEGLITVKNKLTQDGVVWLSNSEK
jgi:hypothetical protein